MGGDEGGVVAGQNLAANGNDAVAVMIVQIISKGIFSHLIAGVFAGHFEDGFRECPAEPGHPIQPLVFGKGFLHDAELEPYYPVRHAF